MPWSPRFHGIFAFISGVDYRGGMVMSYRIRYEVKPKRFWIWGVVGAAVASLLTQIFTNVVIGFIIKPIRPNNRLMIAALNPVFLIAGMKQLLKKKGMQKQKNLV